jgi:hypothetical protein
MAACDTNGGGGGGGECGECGEEDCVCGAGDPDITWTLTQIGGDADNDSTAIRIAFNSKVDNLLATQIAITGAAEIAAGALTEDGNAWVIPITVSATDYASVTITRTGVEAGPKTVMVYKAGVAPPITFNLAANGTINEVPSTQITITFSEAVTGLAAGDITITAGTGAAIRGVLSGSGTTWTVAISDVSPGTVTVGINKEGISATAQPVTVHVMIPVTISLSGDLTGDVLVTDYLGYVFDSMKYLVIVMPDPHGWGLGGMQFVFNGDAVSWTTTSLATVDWWEHQNMHDTGNLYMVIDLTLFPDYNAVRGGDEAKFEMWWGDDMLGAGHTVFLTRRSITVPGDAVIESAPRGNRIYLTATNVLAP